MLRVQRGQHVRSPVCMVPPQAGLLFVRSVSHSIASPVVRRHTNIIGLVQPRRSMIYNNNASSTLYCRLSRYAPSLSNPPAVTGIDRTLAIQASVCPFGLVPNPE